MKTLFTHITTVAIALLALCMVPEQAMAKGGTIQGKVTLPSGTDYRTVVVYLKGNGLRATIPTTPKRIRQKNKRFDPPVLPVVDGTTVAFPNEDRVMHNVFSRTEGSAFDLGYYRRGKSKGVKFGKHGSVNVYCNIHPDMIATVLVLANDHFTLLNPDGTFRLAGVPAGGFEVVAWIARGKPSKKNVKVRAGGTSKVNFTLSTTDKGKSHVNKQGLPYGRYK